MTQTCIFRWWMWPWPLFHTCRYNAGCSSTPVPGQFRVRLPSAILWLEGRLLLPGTVLSRLVAVCCHGSNLVFLLPSLARHLCYEHCRWLPGADLLLSGVTPPPCNVMSWLGIYTWPVNCRYAMLVSVSYLIVCIQHPNAIVFIIRITKATKLWLACNWAREHVCKCVNNR